VKSLGFDAQGKGGKKLSRGIRFRQVEVAHEENPVTEERAYLYFWPGGETQRAAIQVQRGTDDVEVDSDVLTLLVSPLTGKVRIERGAHDMPRPRDEEEASERDDKGF
jgi:general secretion pathway protein H